MAAQAIGRYQIIREIGRGAAAVVYEVQDTQLGRAVALKVLTVGANLMGAARREAIERFYREARAASKLSHPNIAQIYDVGQDGGRHYIAMELCQGVTLRDILRFEGRISEARVKAIALQILNALEAAHAAGIIHRDIKPENIVVGQNDRIKLTDFGIAKVLSDATMTQTGMMLGTPAYMSPEQVLGKSVDARSDLFSLGVVLYECLSGRKPFEGDTITAVTHKIAYVDPDPLTGVASPWPEIVTKALCKAPTNRYQCATDMLSDIRADRAPYQPRQAAQPVQQQVNQTIYAPAPPLPDGTQQPVPDGQPGSAGGTPPPSPAGGPVAKKSPPAWASCAAVVLLFLLFWVIDLVSSPTAVAPVTPGGSSSGSRTGSGLTVVDWQFRQGDYSGEITGIVRNDSSRTYDYAQIEFNLYDSAGNQVGSTFDNINNLAPGATWRFKAIVFEDEAAYARLEGITAF